MSQSELENRYGEILFTTEFTGGIAWVFRVNGFYPINIRGNIIDT